MLVTLDVSRFRGWLNAVAKENMLSMLVTLDVSRFRGWLNAAAKENMLSMFVTLEVFQLEMSVLNFCREVKR